MKKVKSRKTKFEKKQTLKKILIPIIFFIITFCILFNILFLINTTISNKSYFHLFGISFFCIDTELMEDDLSKYDFIITKEVKESELKINDIIAYEMHDKIRINKIVSKDDGYITKFNQNYYPNIDKVSKNQIIGKKIIKIPLLGILLIILQSKVTSIILFFFLFFIYFYYKYKARKERERFKKKDQYIKENHKKICT